jgi:hypothetical protein
VAQGAPALAGRAQGHFHSTSRRATAAQGWPLRQW